ncbi:MAG: ATP-grasp domain-containing protein [Marinilabiliaceae bacterium]|nr:ATP-grasp domain-containing protein [Marinilabiliaceae bacterium]
MFREYISDSHNELVIYAADNFSQFPRRDSSIVSRTDRALAVACSNDLVLLRSRLDQDYHNWIRSFGLGSDLVVDYGADLQGLSLSELIIINPEPVLEMIQKTNRRPVYVPWFSGNIEKEAAKILGADLFGASESETLKYNDKASFKNICIQLDIPVVNGVLFNIQAQNSKNYSSMTNIVKKLLHNHRTVIIRGTLGELGTSLYKTTGNDIAEIYQSILSSCEKTVLIEPFLNVFSSPNDQWIISRDGSIHHIGINEQICNDGMVHAGNSNNIQLSEHSLAYIIKTSRKILSKMASTGYIGIVGIDYIITDTGIFPIENNARFNGSSYVNLIVDNIQKATGSIPVWKSMKVKIPPCSFTELMEILKDNLYNGVKIDSIFPYNCEDLNKTGNFSLIYLAENAMALSILEQSIKELCVAPTSISG